MTLISQKKITLINSPKPYLETLVILNYWLRLFRLTLLKKEVIQILNLNFWFKIFDSGAFDCDCNEGFEGDGESCLDIDECADSPCGQNSVCTNLAGSFECACDSGFGGDDCEVI